KAGSCRASSYAAVSCSRANISVSGTYRPPYGPNRPRASGRDTGGGFETEAVGMRRPRKGLIGHGFLCRLRSGVSRASGAFRGESSHSEPQCGDSKDDRIQLLEIPELGEVEADGRRVRERPVLDTADKVRESAIDGGARLRRDQVEQHLD